MTVLDAFAVLALLRDEPAAEPVARLIENEPTVSLTTTGVAEVLDRLIRLVGADEDEAMLDVAQLGLDDPIPLEGHLAARAGRLRARHYHRKERAVSLADCVAAEAARGTDRPLATADPHLLDMCTAEVITVLPLPDSSGETWSP